MLPETTQRRMVVAPSVSLKLLPLGAETPMPRPFGRADVPVGSVPMKRSLKILPLNFEQPGAVAPLTETPLPWKPLMATLVTCAEQLVMCSPSPLTVPPPLISTSGPSPLVSPRKAVCVDPSRRVSGAVSLGSGVVTRIVFQGVADDSAMRKAITHE